MQCVIIVALVTVQALKASDARSPLNASWHDDWSIAYSGFDRFAGPEGLRACCLGKSVVVDRASFIKTTIPGLLQYPIAPGGYLFGKAMVNVVYGMSISAKIGAVFDMIKAQFVK